MGIILNEYQEEECSIKTHNSDDIEIKNNQGKILLYCENNLANSFESQFDSKFQGEADPFYNCHGLTFACKRTGIYSDEEIWKIIKTEYIPIKSEKDVLVGDVILYFDIEEKQILHSAVVVVANHDLITDIRVYSKVLKGREIVHRSMKCPYYFGVNTIKYFRITHANKFKRLS